MLGGLLNRILLEHDPSETALRLRELAWSPHVDADLEDVTGENVLAGMMGLSVALFHLTKELEGAYAEQVWWLGRLCRDALDILEGVSLWSKACGRYVSREVWESLVKDYEALQEAIDARAAIVGVHSLGEQFRQQRLINIKASN